MKKKKSSKKVIWVVIIVIVVMVASKFMDRDFRSSVSSTIDFFAGAGELSDKDVQNDNKMIDIVKKNSPEFIQNITYDKAYSYYFKKPTWKYFDATTGEKVVEFAGGCKYAKDGNAKVHIQFLINKDNSTFQLYYIKLETDGKEIDIKKSEKLSYVYSPFSEYSEKKLGKSLSKNVKKSFEKEVAQMGSEELSEK